KLEGWNWHDHNRKQNQLHRRGNGRQPRGRRDDAGPPRSAHNGVANARYDSRGEARCGGDANAASFMRRSGIMTSPPCLPERSPLSQLQPTRVPEPPPGRQLPFPPHTRAGFSLANETPQRVAARCKLFALKCFLCRHSRNIRLTRALSCFTRVGPKGVNHEARPDRDRRRRHFGSDGWGGDGKRPVQSSPPSVTPPPHPPALPQAIPRPPAIPADPTVDPPAKPTALLPRPPTPPALVRRPIASPRKPMPLKAPARGSGTLVPVRRNGAVCASLMSISIAVTASKRRARSHARSNARRSIRSRCLRDAERRHGYPGRP